MKPTVVAKANLVIELNLLTSLNRILLQLLIVSFFLYLFDYFEKKF